MATTNKGRGGYRSRTTGGYFFSPFGTFGTGTTRSSAQSTKRSGRTKGGSSMTGGYKTVCNQIQNKINSYKTLINQTKGTPSKLPSPSTINSMCNWINKGAIVQTCSPTQVARWARTTNKNFNTRNPSPTACKNVLYAKFGKSTIKAVAKGKSGFIVATTPTKNGRSFCFPK